jgi:hypothetical protein
MIKRTYSRLNTNDESLFMQGSHLNQPDSPDFNKKKRAAPWGSSTSAMFAFAPPRRVVLLGLLIAVVCFGAVSSSRASLTGTVSAGVSSLTGAHNILCEGLPSYVVFVDAGSTGCRAHTFQVVPGELPAFALRSMGKKVKGHTPLASLAGKTDEQITEVGGLYKLNEAHSLSFNH